MCVDINEHKFEGVGKTKKEARMMSADKAVQFLLAHPEYIQKPAPKDTSSTGSCASHSSSETKTCGADGGSVKAENMSGDEEDDEEDDEMEHYEHAELDEEAEEHVSLNEISNPEPANEQTPCNDLEVRPNEPEIEVKLGTHVSNEDELSKSESDNPHPEETSS